MPVFFQEGRTYGDNNRTRIPRESGKTQTQPLYWGQKGGGFDGASHNTRSYRCDGASLPVDHRSTIRQYHDGQVASDWRTH